MRGDGRKAQAINLQKSKKFFDKIRRILLDFTPLNFAVWRKDFRPGERLPYF